MKLWEQLSQSASTVPASYDTDSTKVLIDFDTSAKTAWYDRVSGAVVQNATDANITLSTTSKFGKHSADIQDGTSPYFINTPNSLNSTSNFTIEFWLADNEIFNPINNSQTFRYPIVSTIPISLIPSATNGFNISVLQTTNETFDFFYRYMFVFKSNNTYYELYFEESSPVQPSYSSTSFAHIAFVKNGNTGSIYINGTLKIQNTNMFTTWFGLQYGNTHFGGTTDGLNADYRFRIDEYRFSSVARYTSNFTPPSSKFPYPEPVNQYFNSLLYIGTGNSRNLSTGVDLSAGGAVFGKILNTSGNWNICDTARTGAFPPYLIQTTAAQTTPGNAAISRFYGFSNNQISLGSDASTNGANNIYTAHLFKRQANFFDLFVYNGDGTGSRTISHTLGTTPGAAIIKPYNSVGDWILVHRSAGLANYAVLNSASNNIASSRITAWDSSSITIASAINSNGISYVVYLFAHNTDTTTGKVFCSEYNGSTSAVNVNIGWKPDMLIIWPTQATTTKKYAFMDRTNALDDTGNLNDNITYFNVFDSQQTTSNVVTLTTTGFTALASAGEQINLNGNTYNYIAIRR